MRKRIPRTLDYVPVGNKLRDAASLKASRAAPTDYIVDIYYVVLCRPDNFTI